MVQPAGYDLGWLIEDVERYVLSEARCANPNPPLSGSMPAESLTAAESPCAPELESPCPQCWNHHAPGVGITMPPVLGSPCPRCWDHHAP
eukprot:2737991-Prymnesium_polylepis.1